MQQDKTYELNKSAVKSSKRQTYRAQSELPTHYVRYNRTSGRAARNTSELPFLGKSQNFQKHALWNFHTAHPRYFLYAELPTCGRSVTQLLYIRFSLNSTCQKHSLSQRTSVVLPSANPRYYRTRGTTTLTIGMNVWQNRLRTLKQRERSRCVADQTMLLSRWIYCSKSERSGEYQPSDLNLKAHNPQQFGRSERSLQ